MATKASYRYQLVTLPPPDDVVCPICLDIVVEPHQLTCCGQHLCEGCGQELKDPNFSCPLCREESYEISRDKYFERKILNHIQVYCSEKDEGCPMQGELGEMLSHMRDCEYKEEECPLNCGRSYQHRHLKGHTSNDCPRRPHQCEYCGYESTYTDVTDVHMPLCDKAQQIIRRDKQIREKDQQIQERDAQIKEMDNKLKEKDQEIREKDQQIQEMNEQIREKDQQIIENLQEKDEKFKLLEQKINILLISHNVNMHYINMEGFADKKRREVCWFSLPYYLHGYKMCFEVDLQSNYSKEYKSRYLRIDHYLMRGTIDHTLEWPFRGKVIVQVVNQAVAVRGNNSYNYEYDYSKAASNGDRVVDDDRGAFFETTSRKHLAMSELSFKRYLVDDTLKFIVTLCS